MVTDRDKLRAKSRAFFLLILLTLLNCRPTAKDSTDFTAVWDSALFPAWDGTADWELSAWDFEDIE